MRTHGFRPDGYAELRSRVKESGVEKVEEFTDVDVSDHWLDPLELGRLGPDRPPPAPAPVRDTLTRRWPVGADNPGPERP